MNALLLCPVCREALTRGERTFTCPRGHAYDIAREGYVNLMAGKPPAVGDNREMIAARRRTLDSGVYAPLREALCRAVEDGPHGVLLDAGCGEGYYTEEMARHFAATVGIDISKEALRLCARRLLAATVAVASAYHLPIASDSVSTVSAVFAPLATEEFARVLAPRGRLVLAVPGPRHLFAMKRVLYDTPYENEVQSTALAGFSLLDVTPVTFPFTLPTQGAIADLFTMTPYYYRTPKAGRDRLAALPSLDLEADFRVLVYEKE
jgi:23S rRNA (guanine745-N1)-methyltransferase